MNDCIKILLFFFLLNIILKTYKGDNNEIKITSKNFLKKRIIKDILFINGCDYKIIPHPYRYRVLHQIEQLNSGNLECSELYYLDLNPLIVINFRIIIFYRCPWTQNINDTINLA